jgi:hypothetical protein
LVLRKRSTSSEQHHEATVKSSVISIGGGFFRRPTTTKHQLFVKNVPSSDEGGSEFKIKRKNSFLMKNVCVEG